MLRAEFHLNYSPTAKLPWSPHAYHPSGPRAVECRTEKVDMPAKQLHTQTHSGKISSPNKSYGVQEEWYS